MQVKTQYTFSGIVEAVRFNQITTAVFLPHHIIIELPKGRVRVSGSLNGAPFSLAILFRKDGSRYFSVGASLRRAANIETGDTVHVAFKILDMHHVELPGPLDKRVDHHDEASKHTRKVKLQSGKVLVNFIQAVKSVDSRLRTSIESIQRSKSASPQPDQHKRNRNK